MGTVPCCPEHLPFWERHDRVPARIGTRCSGPEALPGASLAMKKLIMMRGRMSLICRSDLRMRPTSLFRSLMFELRQDHALLEAPTASYAASKGRQIVPISVNAWISEWAFECLCVRWITCDFEPSTI
jgi:hypothetical protein